MDVSIGGGFVARCKNPFLGFRKIAEAQGPGEKSLLPRCNAGISPHKSMVPWPMGWNRLAYLSSHAAPSARFRQAIGFLSTDSP